MSPTPAAGTPPEQYARIFTAYAGKMRAAVPPGVLEALLERYRTQGLLPR